MERESMGLSRGTAVRGTARSTFPDIAARRRMVRRLLILPGYLSVYWDMAASRASRLVASSLSTFVRKVGFLAISVTVAVLAAALGWYAVSVVVGLPALSLIGSHARGWVGRRLMVQAISRQKPDLAHIPPADVTLARMGLDHDAMAAVLERAGPGEEVRLAILDQNNRVLSEVGPIELFRGHLIAAGEFRARSRNEVEIVIRAGVVAVKKTYGHRMPFSNELIALHALRELEGTPRIVAVKPRGRTIYQSFIPGSNLGSLLAERGASVSAQHRMVRDYRARPDWKDARGSLVDRERALEALRGIVGADFVERLGELFLNVQAAGVVLSDIKYGNVLLLDGRPHLCDFDFSRHYSKGGTRFYLERDRARDRFNYMFGADLATEDDLRGALAALAERRPDLVRRGVYLGEGLGFGRLFSPASATGRWLRLRRHVPALQGRRVLGLGSGDGVVALEMLRAGANGAIASETDPGMAELTVLCQRFLELIDNRRYDLVLSRGAPGPVSVERTAPRTIILALGQLSDESLGDLEGIVSRAPEAIEMIAIDTPIGSGAPEGSVSTRLIERLEERGLSRRVVNLYTNRPYQPDGVAERPKTARAVEGDVEDAIR